MQNREQSLSGFRAFMVVLGGQLVSLVGTQMAQFALIIWTYEKTESATALALLAFFGFAPLIAVTPFAGTFVDRWNRKWTMMVSDGVAGVATMIIFALHLSDALQIWHLYVALALSGVSNAFQFPAFSASITLMLDEEHYARANGMQSVVQSASGIAAPVLAGMLLAFIGLSGVLIIDIITFLFAISALAVVHIPQPAATKSGQESRGSFFKETAYGFTYIWKRPSLLGMQIVFALANLFGGMAFVLLPALVLSRTGNDELALGTVQALIGVGGLLGGLAISIWGGPKRRVHGVLLGMILSSLLGQMTVGVGQSVLVWAAGGFLMMLFIPMVNASNQAIWQSKVAPDVQGRVFSVRRLIAQVTGPLAMVIAGPLADYVFEPGMAAGGALVPLFGDLVGTGPGAGIAVIFLVTGTLGTISGLAGYGVRVVRNIEDILPNHAAAVEKEKNVPAGDESPVTEGVPAGS